MKQLLLYLSVWDIDYNIDGTDNDNRITYFIQKGSMLLDFITDNLMPYLGENYCID